MARIPGRVSINGKNRFSSVFCTFGRAVLVETWISSFANDNPIDYMVLRPEAKSQPIWRIEDNDIAAQLRFIWIFLTYPYKLSFTSSLIRAGSFITDAVRAAHCARTVRWSHFFFFFSVSSFVFASHRKSRSRRSVTTYLTANRTYGKPRKTNTKPKHAPTKFQANRQNKNTETNGDRAKIWIWDAGQPNGHWEKKKRFSFVNGFTAFLSAMVRDGRGARSLWSCWFR